MWNYFGYVWVLENIEYMSCSLVIDAYASSGEKKKCYGHVSNLITLALHFL